MKQSELIERAKSPEASVRAKVARHKDCPPDLLVELAKDSSDLVIINAVSNPNFPLPEMEKLVKDFITDKNNWSRESYRFHLTPNPISYFSENPALPADLISSWLDMLINVWEAIDADPYNRSSYGTCQGSQELLSLPNCPSKYIDYFINQKTMPLNRYIIKNPNLTIKQVTAMSRELDYDETSTLIRNPNKIISEYVIEKIISRYLIRSNIFLHQNLREAFLHTENPILKERLVEVLMSSDDNRIFLARRTKDVELLKTLAIDADPEVRRVAGKNKVTPLEAKVASALLGSKKLKYEKE
jgi:hypothetical protein